MHRRRFVGIVGLLIVICSGCLNTSEKTQPQEGSLVAREEAASPAVLARAPDEAEMLTLMEIQRSIMTNPQSDSLRRELGRRAIDAPGRVMWTVGVGRATDPASAVALRQAERAAWIDGSRWAAYLLEWQKNNYRSPFGSLEGQVPGSSIERKSVIDSLCVVLVKTSLPAVGN
jgi:hypothetical protein